MRLTAVLLDLIEQDLGPPPKQSGGRVYWRCPFHNDHDPSLTVTPDGRRYKCFGCDKSGDDIAWLQEYRGLNFAEAHRLARGEEAQGVRRGEQRRTKAKREPRPAVATEAEGPTWDQEAALAVVRECEAVFWSDAGAKAREALAARGISEDTARLWRLGYNPRERHIHGLWVRKGGVIPCFIDDLVQYIKVRRGPSDYVQVKGGKSAIFGLDHLTTQRVVVICEAELDALLLWQEAGDLVDVVALGSKGTKPALPYLTHLAGAARWLLALDCDADKEVEWWGDFSARMRRVRPLQGNDLTDFYRAGGDLRAWVTYHLDLLQAPAGAKTPGKPEDREQFTGSEAQAAPPPAARGHALETSAFDTAEELLARIDAGDLSAVGEYAHLAEAQGWRCYGMSWPAWSAEVVGEREPDKRRPLPRRVADGVLQRVLL